MVKGNKFNELTWQRRPCFLHIASPSLPGMGENKAVMEAYYCLWELRVLFPQPHPLAWIGTIWKFCLHMCVTFVPPYRPFEILKNYNKWPGWEMKSYFLIYSSWLITTVKYVPYEHSINQLNHIRSYKIFRTNWSRHMIISSLCQGRMACARVGIEMTVGLEDYIMALP